MTVRVFNRTRSTPLATRCQVASSLKDRVIGLLGRRSLEQGEGLWIHRCSSIHMIGMRFAIDVVFLDRASRVVGAAPYVRPFHLRFCLRKADSALELPAGTIAGSKTEVGDVIEFSSADT